MDTKTYIAIKDTLRIIIAGTEFENNVFAVGGCCRDEILGLPIKDLDLVVSLPDGGIRFAKWLEDNNLTVGTVVTYPRFGTAMFRLKDFPNEDLEVVQTRTEVYESDSRKPDTAYGSIKEDCLRRDLTINAIYYDISNSKMLDVCGSSFDDIKNHVINTPCDPDKTYIDDPLRIMRCVRFANRFNWKIEPRVFESMKRNIDRLSVISKERINDEFTKIINKNIAGVFTLIEIGANKYIFPSLNVCEEFKSAMYNSENLKNIWNTFTKIYDTDRTKLGIIAIFNDNMEQEMRVLKYSVEDIRYTMKLKELYNFALTVNSRSSLRKFHYMTKDITMLMNVHALLTFTNKHIYYYDNYSSSMNMMMNMMQEDLKMIDYKLPIDGNEIMSILNIGPSKKIKEITNALLEHVFETPGITKNELIKFIKENYE